MAEIIGPSLESGKRVTSAEIAALHTLGAMSDEMFEHFKEAIVREKRKKMRIGDGKISLASLNSDTP